MVATVRIYNAETRAKQMQFGCRRKTEWRGVEWVVVGSSVASGGQCVADGLP
jgi:hypothetical protein